MVLTRLCVVWPWRHRHREQICRHWVVVGKGEGGVDGESSMEIFILLHVKQIPGENYVYIYTHIHTYIWVILIVLQKPAQYCKQLSFN